MDCFLRVDMRASRSAGEAFPIYSRNVWRVCGREPVPADRRWPLLKLHMKK
jgi:hypothetical protein